MSQCDGNCQSTQSQAIAYMNNEMLWAKIIVLAWQDADVFNQMQNLARANANANDFLQSMYNKYGVQTLPNGDPNPDYQGFPPPSFVPDVETRIVIDTSTVVHLIMPPVEHIPPAAIDMVPHAF